MTSTGFPLSAQQRRVWSYRAHGPRSVRALRLEGDLDPALLRRALEAVVARHEILRTSFPSAAGLKLPLQAIAEAGEVGWEVLDGTEGSLDAALARALEPGPEPEAGPPLRAWLAALGPAEHGLVLAACALCADRASLDVVVDDLGRAYAAAAGGTGAERPDPVQYADFAGWQETLPDEDDAADARGFWRERLEVVRAQAPLPFERPASEASQAAEAVRLLDPDLAARVESAGRAAGGDPESFLAACWHAVLWRAAQPPRLAVGHVLDGRPLDDLDDAVGPYAQSVPVVSRAEPGVSFAALHSEVATGLTAARERQQHFGLDGEDALGAPWQFEWRATPPEPAWDGLSVQAVAEVSREEPHAARLTCSPAAEGIRLALSHDPARVATADAERLLAALAECVRAAAQAPDTEVDRLALVDAAQAEAALSARAGGAGPEPPAATWHDAIARQAAATPDAVAVEFEAETLTYAELLERAEGLASRLRARGVGPDARVGICLERSAAFVTAIAATHRAGGGYVPLDPDYPSAYANRILSDSDARVLITQESLRAGFAEASVPLLVLDAPDDAGDVAEAEAPGPPAGPDDLAYAIYTSGSTGEPKGVMVTHRSVMGLAGALREAVYAGREGPLRVTVNAPFTFDASVKQLVQLCFGHTLHVLPAELRLDAHALSDHLEHRGVDVLDCTPSQLRPLLNAIEIHEGRTRPSVVLVGGEAVGEELWTALRQRSGLEAFNVYGPTEGTDLATVARVADSEAPVIGRPLPGVQALVLDPDLRPVPDGFLGELCIAGWGVARGYIGAPELTAQAFVEHPAGGAERLYRTGDLARRRDDGAIEYLGRRDRQVKVRGFRVGLGEIEAALARHAAVAEVSVVDVRTPAGSRRLSAFVVSAQPGDRVVEALREHAERELPEHMHPASYELLDSLPTTAHGKVDVAQLRERASRRPDAKVDHTPPRNPTEELLAEIWSSVLEADRVGVHDDFFDAGGDSISQIIVVARARDRGLELTPRDVFERPTIAQLAEICEAAPAAS